MLQHETEEDVACPTCQDKMEIRKTQLMGLDVTTLVCVRCGEVIYDFSGKGESCRDSSACSACLWRELSHGEMRKGKI
ncbi:MAG: hypothetical protein V3R86_06305 [Candidatus Hydrothermarchaeaceae archaeon]